MIPLFNKRLDYSLDVRYLGRDRVTRPVGLIRFNCPKCGQRLKTANVNAGRTAVCQGCSRPIVVPALERLAASS